MVDEARSLTYSINVRAVLSQAEEDIQNFIGSLGRLRTEAGDVTINADTEQASENVRDLTADINGLRSDAGDTDIIVDADTSGAEESVRDLAGDLGNLGDTDVDIGADTTDARSDVQDLTDDIGNLGDHAGDIDIDADTSGARRNIRDLTDDIGDLNEDAGSIGSAFRKSFLSGIDSGKSFGSSIRDGVGGAFDFAKSKANDFKDDVVQGAQNIKNGFAHPIETIKTGLGNAIQSAKDKFIDMARGADRAADGAEDMGDAADDAADDVDDLSKSTSEAGDAAEKSGSKFEKMGGILKGIGAAIGAATIAVGAFAGTAVGVGMDFDSSMSQVAATMGYSVEEINTVGSEANKTFTELRGFAMEMGANTAFSATQAADALNYMALAGYDSEKSMSMLPNVLNLAAAGGIELADASDMITDAQSALGLTMDETTELVDKMARASSKSNTSVAQLGSAILTVGGTAKNLAGGTTELSMALGVLADNGVKGAEGGTALRNIILSLGAPTDKAAKQLKALGVEVYDAEGNMRPLNETFGALNSALGEMTQNERTQIISELFNKADLKSVNALLGTSAERWDELGTAIDNADGAAQAMADTQLDNLAGDITLFKSALEGAQIVVADQLNPTLREFVQFGSSAISTLSTAFQEGGLSGAMGALGGILSDGLGMVVGMLPTLVDAGAQLLGALGQGILDNVPMLIEAATQIVVTLADSITSSMSGMDSTGSDTLTHIVDSITDNLPILIGAAGQIILALATGIGSNLPELIPSVVETLLIVASSIIENLPMILDAGMQIIGGLTEGIVNAIPILVEQLPELILQIVGFLSENLPTILEQGSQMLLSLGMGIINAVPQLVAQLPTIISSIVGFVSENLPLIVETGVNLVVQLGVGLIQAIPGLVAQLPQIISAILGGFAEAPTMLLNVGKSIVQGLWNGISEMGSWIKEKVTGFFGGIVDGVKGLLGIHSPSTVFENEVGTNMALGLGNGFTKAMKGVTKDIEDSIPTDFDLPKDFDLPNGNAPDANPKGAGQNGNAPEGMPYPADLPDYPDQTYRVNPVVGDINTPQVDDTFYHVNPVVGDFNPPDVSADAVYNDAAPVNESSGASGGWSGEGGSSVPAFAPVINITVEGGATEQSTENLREALYDTVKELYEEFRQEELEHTALKEQYAFQ